MTEIHIVPNAGDFERNEITVRMEPPPPQWVADGYWLKVAASIARLVPVSVEADEDPAQLIPEVHARLFPRHLFGNQG